MPKLKRNEEHKCSLYTSKDSFDKGWSDLVTFKYTKPPKILTSWIEKKMIEKKNELKFFMIPDLVIFSMILDSLFFCVSMTFLYLIFHIHFADIIMKSSYTNSMELQ